MDLYQSQGKKCNAKGKTGYQMSLMVLHQSPFISLDLTATDGLGFKSSMETKEKKNKHWMSDANLSGLTLISNK